MPNKPPQTFECTMEFDGKKHTASYSVKSGVVTVESALGRRSTQVGGSTAQMVARMLLREILQGAKERGEI